MLYAHTPNDDGEWHTLDRHLQDVAELAAEHASAFGSEDAAWWAGILHDAGKASEEFQRYLRLCAEQPDRKHQTVDHKGAGFLRALEVLEALAIPIQAHHGGLIDQQEIGIKYKEVVRRGIELRLTLERFDALELIPDSMPLPEPPAFAEGSVWAFEFWLRMLFSALVDADHFDTERHWNHDASELRGSAATIPELWSAFQRKQHAFVAQLAPEALDSEMNRARGEVYDACLLAAEGEPGFYRLTVPTGGGKTRSGLAFALKHAALHEQRRVIMAVPYLTITDQTARIVRSIFPDDRIVLEHFSAAGQPEDDEAGMQEEREAWRRLAAQDWNAPLVVTTMVQLFESLLGRKTTVCRKLHRIAGSVILLDEAQTIPLTLRDPVFDVLRELVTNYGVTVVLCTATQPALDTLPEGIVPAEIVPDPTRLFRTLERVKYRWPAPGEPNWSWERTASEMSASDQSLAIVNTVANASSLFSALGGDEAGHFHLSSRMCGAHRRDVVDLIRARLTSGERCRLVSTQVVEAGVDIDFPLLLRALGPLDRIVQAAGRCNREGKLDGFGTVVVFEPAEGGMPPGPYRLGSDTTTLMRTLLGPEGTLDLNDPETFASYFKAVNKRVPPDAPGIQQLRAKRDFKTVAEKFRLIPDDQVSVLVRYRGLDRDGFATSSSEVDELIEHIETAIAGRNSNWLRGLLRRAQPYLVNVRRGALRQYSADRSVRELTDGLWLWIPQYDNKLGLVSGRADVESLII